VAEGFAATGGPVTAADAVEQRLLQRSARKPGAWRGRVDIKEGFDELPESVKSGFGAGGA